MTDTQNNNTLFRWGTHDGWATTTHFLGNQMEQSTISLLREARRDPKTYANNGSLAKALYRELDRLPESAIELIYLIACYKAKRVKNPLKPVGGMVTGDHGGNRVYLQVKGGSMEIRIKHKDRAEEIPAFDLLFENLKLK